MRKKCKKGVEPTSVTPTLNYWEEGALGYDWMEGGRGEEIYEQIPPIMPHVTVRVHSINGVK